MLCKIKSIGQTQMNFIKIVPIGVKAQVFETYI